MVKGPKALLSHAIADALAEHFEVDPNTIESSLITDTKIVLQNAKLRDKEIHSNESVAIVTGSVDEVSFRWKWNVSSESSKKRDVTEVGWVKDAVLTIKGLRFKAQLTRTNKADGSSETDVKRSLAEHAQTSDTAAENSTSKMEAEPKKDNEGGIRGYMARQVQSIIDSLTLDVVDFEFIVEMPDSNVDKRTTCIVIGGKTVEIRREASDQHLEQRLTIASFFASVVVSAAESTCDSLNQESTRDSLKQVTHLLLEPFSYSATITRLLGRRFDGMGTGINLIGRPIATSVESLLATGTDRGVVLHAGAVQVQALTRLASMVLAPTDDDNAKPPAAEEHNVRPDVFIDDTKEDKQVDNQMVDTTPSLFEIPVTAMSLVIMEDTIIVVSDINLTYKADGTLFKVDAQRFDLGRKSEAGEAAGAKCSISSLKCRLRPTMVLEMGAIETLYVPGVIDLTEQLCNPSMAFQGDALSIDLGSVEAIIPYKKEEKKQEATCLISSAARTTQSDKIAESTIQDSRTMSKHLTFQQNDIDSSSSTMNVMAPFPIYISLQELKLKQASRNSLILLQDLIIKLKPDRTDVVGTAVLVHLGEFKNELLQFRNANVTALLPRDGPDVIYNFKLDAESVHVHAGHSTEEWSEKFEPPAAAEKKSESKKGPQKMPLAEVAPLDIRIAYKGAGVTLKETAVIVQPFIGKAETTSNDLLLYYTQACLSRVPGFISNAEVLGVNVMTTTATTYAAWGATGMGGAYGGLAAVAAIDVAKGVMAVGKESRNVTPDDRWKPGDFIRGAAHMPGAIAKAGAQKKSGEESEATKGENFVADFAVGAYSTTGEYVGENKSRLGAAGAAGMGVIYGTMLGGPIGGIIGGVLVGAAAGKAIETIEESVNDRVSEKIEGDFAEQK